MRFPRFNCAKDWILLLLAFSFAGLSIYLTSISGMGAGGAIALCLIISTIMLIVLSGKKAVLYVAIYGLLISIYTICNNPELNIESISIIVGTLFITPTTISIISCFIIKDNQAVEDDYGKSSQI